MTIEQSTEQARATVEVALGARSYAIVIGAGLLAEAGARLAPLVAGGACAIVTDRNVASHHLAALTHSLSREGLRHTIVTVEPGEVSKSYAVYAEVCDALLAARLERGDLILALGGGVVGDLAGFVAATLKRGLRFAQLPTTLLAQVDSSVGGKTGINSPHGKNLIGAFHQPSLVLADTDTLDTLPERQFRAGYAEVVKYGLIDDADFFDWLDRSQSRIYVGGAARIEAIARSCAAKAAMVARDETERGDRALLNLGHTFGHALERLVGYDGTRLVHGEAVSIGMMLAFGFSVEAGLCPPVDAARLERHLVLAGLPTRICEIPGWRSDSSAMLEAMFQDKKVTRGSLNLILARGIGRSYVARGVDVAEVRRFLDAEVSGC